MTTQVLPSCVWPGVRLKLRVETMSDRDREIVHGSVGRLSITREGLARFEVDGAVVVSRIPVPLGRWVQIEASRYAVTVTELEGSPFMTTPTKDEARAAAVLRHGIAQAIHDGPHAQQQYRDARIAEHRWEDCRYQDEYLQDADAVVAFLASRVSTPPSEAVEWIDRTLSLPVYEDVATDSYAEGVVDALRTVRKLLTRTVPAVPVLPTEPEGRCSKCGVKVTDQTPSTFYASHDETCGGDLSEPTEPEENR